MNAVDQSDVNRTLLQRYSEALTRFLGAQEAVRDLILFAEENVSALDEGSPIARSVAERKALGVTSEEAEKAHDIVKAFLIEMGTTIEKNTGKDGNGESQDKGVDGGVIKGQVAQLMQDLGEAVPGRNSSRLFLSLVNSQAKVRRARLPLMMSSMLISVVSDFEVLFGGVAKEFYRSKPEALRASEQKFSWSDIDGYESIEEFREHVIDQNVENLLRGSFDDWIVWLKKKAGVTLGDELLQLEQMREIFQRRHIAVHNGGRVSRQYLLKLPHLSDPPAIGTELSVNSEYALMAVDRLTIAAILVANSVTRKGLGSRHSAAIDSWMQNIVYDLLREGRNRVVEQVSKAVYADIADEYARLVLRVNMWISQRRLYGVDAIKEEVSRWQTSALTAKFKLAQITLLGRLTDAYSLVIELRKNKELSEQEWLEWPLLEEVREFASQLDRSPSSESGGSETP